MVLHAYLVEERNLLNDNPVCLLKSIISVIIFGLYSLKDEQLILFLLIFNKILSTNDGEELLTL